MRDNRDRLRKLLAGRCRTARDIHTATDLYGKVQSLAINAKLDLLGSELTSDGNSHVEQMLIDRVVICWLTLQTLEQEAAREFRRSPGKPSTLEKERDHAHRRYVRALHELARLRGAKGLDEIGNTVDTRDDGELAGEDCAD